MTKALTKLNQQTTRRNAAFRKMTAAQKRVAIARDVLRQVAAKRFRPIRGAYLETRTSITAPLGRTDGAVYAKRDTDLKPLLDRVKRCDVCAIGSMFVSAIGIDNNYTIGEAADQDAHADSDLCVGYAPRGYAMYHYLRRYFSEDTLQAIETSFERDYSKLVALAKLVAIMENIIRNKGRFIRSKVESAGGAA